jgi:hypothetical protein
MAGASERRLFGAIRNLFAYNPEQLPRFGSPDFAVRLVFQLLTALAPSR